MTHSRPLIIVGDSAFAEVAWEYFTHDSPFEVVAFSVERSFLLREELFGLPVVPFEELEQHYDPTAHHFFAATVYTQLNRLRTRLYQAGRAKGFAPASYISPHALVRPSVRVGEHCFIFENNVLQPFVEIGDNVVLWSGNHIGHHARVGSHCFLASQVVVSGFAELGESCFVGVNASIGNNVRVGADCVLGASTLVTRDVPANSVIKASSGEPSRKVGGRAFFKVAEEAG